MQAVGVLHLQPTQNSISIRSACVCAHRMSPRPISTLLLLLVCSSSSPESRSWLALFLFVLVTTARDEIDDGGAPGTLKGLRGAEGKCRVRGPLLVGFTAALTDWLLIGAFFINRFSFTQSGVSVYLRCPHLSLLLLVVHDFSSRAALCLPAHL